MVENIGESLRAMPLHTITQVYGFDGLKERFDLELLDFSTPDKQQLRAGYELAETVHAEDRRQSEPYINHLLRVATRLHHHYGVSDVDVVTAGLLHDAIEDHTSELNGGESEDRKMAADNLTVYSNRRVANMVMSVTNPPDMTGHGDYREHVAELLKDPWARVIKLSDFTDNGIGVFWTKGEMRDKLARKYLPIIPLFEEAIRRDDTPLAARVVKEIMGQLATGKHRLAQIA